MGELYVMHQSFELSHVDQNNRDKVVLEYCECLNKIIKNKDSLYAHEEIESYQYSYGDLYNGLIYKSWDEIKKDPILQSISHNTHNLFHASLFPFPKLTYGNNLNHEDFLELVKSLHFGYNGFNWGEKKEPYVFSSESYKSWFDLFEQEIIWEEVQNTFLPLVTESNKILLKEIQRFEKEYLLDSDVYRDKIGCLFHDEIMKKKGRELITYTIEIGSKVLLKNKYTHDSKLSNAERIASKNSLRHIYFIDSPDGRRYISLDFRHGMFEFFDSKGSHCGEFKFDGSFNSKAEASHNLKTL